MPITIKASKFKGATQHYIVKLPKSVGARHYCPTIPQMLGTLGTRANLSPETVFEITSKDIDMSKSVKLDLTFFKGAIWQ